MDFHEAEKFNSPFNCIEITIFIFIEFMFDDEML